MNVRIIVICSIVLSWANMLSINSQPVQPGQTADVHYLSKPFIHPGMAQNRQDLEFMKQKVLKGEQPWKNAYENLKKETSLNFVPQPFTHISVGPYGANSSGGREFSESASEVYNHALMWYISGNKSYAKKAIEILNAWSAVLWDFDDNNAKLNVGLAGHYFLNAAEILKNSDSGWRKEDIEKFTRMVLTVFYPTIKDFFTEANGNWDASIINTLLCIGVFTDNHEIFNRAVERFYRGPGNSGITKYIYPSGQIQETTRDWGHVQLGIGEFAKAAQVAWTQGLDFYSVADYRLALGYEYTSRFMLGDNVPVYGVISTRERGTFRDIYESIFQHYHYINGIEMPFTSRVIQLTLPKSSGVLLTSLRAQEPITSNKNSVALLASKIAPQAGVLDEQTEQPPDGSTIVMPGESIQDAVKANAGTGKWVILAKGIHTLGASLLIPSGTTLAGQGKESVLFLSPELNSVIIRNSDIDMHDVTIRDLLIEGAIKTATSSDPNNDRRIRSYMSAPSRAGIVFSANRDNQMHNISFEHLTVQNCTKNGVSVLGAAHVVVNNCDFSDNGSNVVPGAGFHHNLHLSHITGCEISNSRFDTSPWGDGIDLSFSSNAAIVNNEATRNKLSGIRCTESENIKVTGNLVEGNDEDGILFDALMDGSFNIEIRDNTSRNNGKSGILRGKVTGSKVTNNLSFDNGSND
jgi:parallel beta-helix repeat protein